MRTALPILLLTVLFVGAPAAADQDWKAGRKAFKAGIRSEDWRTRRSAYTELAYFDGEDAVKEILSAFAKEKNPAVILGGIEVLAAFKSEGAAEALAKALKKSRGEKKLHVLMALERQPGEAGKELLLEVLRGKDEMAQAQAALVLGRKRVVEAIPDLEALARSNDWQLRAAAARALMALQAQDSVPALAESLEMSEGSERGPIIRALTELTGETYGADVEAWKKLASGADPKQIHAKPVKVPHVFGIPIYGRRIVIVLTNSQHNENPHRFGTGKRLEELCEVPGQRPIVHTRLVTVGTFIRAHVKRLLSDMPSGTYGQLLIFNTTVTPLWPKLTPLNSTTKDVANEAIDGAVPYAGMNHYEALVEALDAAGAKDSAAWSRGPDEIVFTACNVPNQGEIKEPDVVAAAVAFKARMRMVPIHTIGVGAHAYDMMKVIAEQTGGVYKNLYE